METIVVPDTIFGPKFFFLNTSLALSSYSFLLLGYPSSELVSWFRYNLYNYASRKQAALVAIIVSVSWEKEGRRRAGMLGANKP